MKLTHNGLAKIFWVMALLLTGCGGGGGTTTAAQTTLTSITITPASATIAKGLTTAFVATAHYSNNTTTDITSQTTWASSDTTVATINASGIAATLKQGVTSVTATSNNITSTSATLTVTAKALASIAVTPAPATVAKGLTTNFIATATYSDASTTDITAQVIWESANPGVASINSATGVATGVAEGSTTVTATANSITSPTAGLTVTAAVITAIAISPGTPATPKGLPVTFTATGTFSNGSTGNISGSVTWASSDTGVATLNSNGVASSLTQGITFITASANTITSNSTTLTVTAPVLASISIASPPASMVLGTAQPFNTNGIMTDGTPVIPTTIWSSSNALVATINGAGLVTTVSPGTTNISASSNGKTAFSVLAVTGYPAGYVAQGGLIWMAVTAVPYTWTNANAYCTGTINGLTGWRMPTPTELSALYGSGVINGHGWMLGATWSSTASGFPGVYTIVALINGAVTTSPDATPAFVSCVR